MGLAEYNAKRQFTDTPEPEGKESFSEEPRFVIQRHHARRQHYDLRLTHNGVLLSWAVPKGPSLDPSVKRLAVRTEDHPLSYELFEGMIPEGNYGAGSVIVWDHGSYEHTSHEKDGTPISLDKALERGHISFRVHGEKLQGMFALTRTDDKNWLLVKVADEHADPDRDITQDDASVLTRRTNEDLEIKKNALATLPWEQQRLLRPGIPTFMVPMSAVTAQAPFSGHEWLFEPKLDGIRVLVVITKGRARIWTRNERDVTSGYPEIERALGETGIIDAVLDGEIVALKDGLPSFSKLQGRMQVREPAPALTKRIPVYAYFFDLLVLGDQSLTRVPLAGRKTALESLGIWKEPLRYTGHVVGKGEEYFSRSCEMNLEGVMAKRSDSPYEHRRSANWKKVRCHNEQEFIIGGYTDPKGGRSKFGALLIGYNSEEGLRYAGKVGTGFSDETLIELHKELVKRERTVPAFIDAIRTNDTHWVEPQLVCQVRFTEWTPDGRLRHPTFLGIRYDKVPEEVVRE